MASKDKKNKSITLVTPKGILKYPKLTQIDYGTDKYPNPEGSYNTQFILNEMEGGVKEFLTKLDELMDMAKAQAEEQLAALPIKSRKDIEAKGGLVANKPYSAIYDEETEEPTGEVELRLKKRASFKNKDGSKEILPPPPLFDSATPPKLLSRKVEVWGGSQANINISVSPYYMNTGAYGLSLRLNAVQIVKLVDAGGAKDAASYGFEGSDDGWASSQMDEDSEETKEAVEAAAEEDDDEANF